MNENQIFRVRVFLSWSGKGSPSHTIALGLKDWLCKVIHFAEPFLSSDNIQAGERWDDVLGKHLSESDFGILCITKQCLNSPWMLFEAGALAGTYRNPRRVVPYLLKMDPGDLNPPLGRFNAVTADKDGTYKMLESLNKTPAGQLVDERVLKEMFKVFWPEMENVLEEAKGLA
jgi:TIR domain